MRKVILQTLAGALFSAGSMAGMAATMEITAEFSPSVSEPTRNTFKNTTPQSGYCASHADQCTNGEFSLATGITLAPTKALTANDTPRDSLYFKMPSAPRTVTVQNKQTVVSQDITFRVSAFSARYWAIKHHGVYDWKDVNYFSEPNPASGCKYVASGWGSTQHFAWLWNYPAGNGDLGCYNLSSIDRPDGSDKYISTVDDVSFGYELSTPAPLEMGSGIYTGTMTLTVGPGGELDFGDNFQPSDSQLTINFTLTVNHELALTTTPENQNVALQPCAAGKVCSEDEGKANWERWMVSLITPQITGRSNFQLSSSGAFTVYLDCAEKVGDSCALASDNSPSQLIPFQTFLTLPDTIVDMATGDSVVRRELAVKKDTDKNIFVTKEYGVNKSGDIDFLIAQQDVDTMLKTRPDTFRGAVVVYFDPSIY